MNFNKPFTVQLLAKVMLTGQKRTSIFLHMKSKARRYAS